MEWTWESSVARSMKTERIGRWRLGENGLTFVRNPIVDRESHGIVPSARIDRGEVKTFLKNLGST
ncbi:hypothetical protein ACFPVX_09275 [Cohnella faecalis]|uniref:Uncharacterized protein n=1 Tax=Cohnella faecalis TaxID=2315694 RepID=A0A398CSF7_9BACL|nr:hypothetical protein [Cohnella faecalis]RIE01884.1 hypothetical protein D3H35_13970 [Cohnella faecalis]